MHLILISYIIEIIFIDEEKDQKKADEVKFIGFFYTEINSVRAVFYLVIIIRSVCCVFPVYIFTK